ncbi:hypothetical protein NSE01_09540 [Novosphingobium sediminis]|uniref:Lipoprotein n=1 Tax=Novosphingobium sediminis TaxID=707214 RepID=A0A512AHF6_9SPHN|nr:hypothetical protein [Novosphingobium sediminis]GEN99121.1 hypothetical protein NSE01_09540 [Novosphingobium sediminis]
MPRTSRPVAPAFHRIARFLPAAVLAAALASCAAPAPPPPPPPPPPPAKPYIPPPPKPKPPAGASENLTIPPLDGSGLRQSVNRNISSTQMLWNLRSALNVAALNCSDPKHAEILPRYKAFLKNYTATLAAANRKVDAEFKARYGAKFTAPREAYMTSVYNHFALPPAMNEFCNAALAVTSDLDAVTPPAPKAAPPKKGAKAAPVRTPTLKPAELEAFAVRSLPNIEVVYDDFYRRYEKYRLDLAEWNARYGPPPAPAANSGTP